MRDIIWVPIKKVIPNPLNPRRDEGIKTLDMQQIIEKRGWEEPITAYRNGDTYVVLSGHRRLYSARQLGEKQVPVFEVPKPNDQQDEVERIASLQRGRVDWTAYEWGKFTYERWLAWGRPTSSTFSKVIGISKRTVDRYITVFEEYPRNDIQHKLEIGLYTFTTLYELLKWLRVLGATKRDIVDSLTIDMIRRTMLAKVEDGLVTERDLRDRGLLEIISDDDLLDFLYSKGTSLADVKEKYGEPNSRLTHRGYVTSLALLKRRVLELKPRHDYEADQYLEQLRELSGLIDKKVKEIRKDN